MKYSFFLKPRRLLTIVLALILLIAFTGCRGDEDPSGETVEATSATDPEVSISTEPTEPPVPTVPATMGTIITGKLNIRADAGSGYDAVGSYLEGDRVEIQETKTVDGTVWGRTGKGWIGMGYVRMDGTAPENSAENNIISDGKFAVLGYGVVDLGSLNVRTGPGTEYTTVKEIPEGARYAYYQTAEGWVRIADGWVSTTYFYVEGSRAEDAANGTIITDDLNIRTGPSTDFKSVGVYKKGDTVAILAQVDRWAYTEKGWISLFHVELTPPTYTTGTGTITSGLNIRKEPNAESEAVGTYTKGDTVTILEVNGEWGKTDKGWINLKYVSFG